MKNIIIKTNNANKTVDTRNAVTKDGKPTVIQAIEKGANYELVDQATGKAPQHIITKRDGKDLHVSFEKEGKESDLIIKDFYETDSALIGQAENGSYYYYVPDTGEVQDFVTELNNGDVEGQALGGEAQATPYWVGAVEAGGFAWLPVLAGLAGAGLVGAALSDDGDDGDDGQDGIDGQDGDTPTINGAGNWQIGDVDTGVPAEGQDGADGTTPHIGDNGNWFVGETDTGVPAKGDKGDTGKSAYDIAVENGFEGTKPEWIESLKGQDGVDGQDGEQGPQGEKGDTPTINDAGNWQIGDVDTGVPAEGVDGQDGVTPHIGDNGNWFVGDTDTGIPAKGDKGDKGDAGKSAYDIAVDNGFKGSEAEWLESLKGEDGQDGGAGGADLPRLSNAPIVDIQDGDDGVVGSQDLNSDSNAVIKITIPHDAIKGDTIEIMVDGKTEEIPVTTDILTTGIYKHAVNNINSLNELDISVKIKGGEVESPIGKDVAPIDLATTINTSIKSIKIVDNFNESNPDNPNIAYGVEGNFMGDVLTTDYTLNDTNLEIKLSLDRPLGVNESINIIRTNQDGSSVNVKTIAAADVEDYTNISLKDDLSALDDQEFTYTVQVLDKNSEVVSKISGQVSLDTIAPELIANSLVSDNISPLSITDGVVTGFVSEKSHIQINGKDVTGNDVKTTPEVTKNSNNGEFFDFTIEDVIGVSSYDKVNVVSSVSDPRTGVYDFYSTVPDKKIDLSATLVDGEGNKGETRDSDFYVFDNDTAALYPTNGISTDTTERTGALSYLDKPETASQIIAKNPNLNSQDNIISYDFETNSELNSELYNSSIMAFDMSTDGNGTFSENDNGVSQTILVDGYIGRTFRVADETALVNDVLLTGSGDDYIYSKGIRSTTLELGSGDDFVYIDKEMIDKRLIEGDNLEQDYQAHDNIYNHIVMDMGDAGDNGDLLYVNEFGGYNHILGEKVEVVADSFKTSEAITKSYDFYGKGEYDITYSSDAVNRIVSLDGSGELVSKLAQYSSYDESELMANALAASTSNSENGLKGTRTGSNDEADKILFKGDAKSIDMFVNSDSGTTEIDILGGFYRPLDSGSINKIFASTDYSLNVKGDAAEITLYTALDESDAKPNIELNFASNASTLKFGAGFTAEDLTLSARDLQKSSGSINATNIDFNIEDTLSSSTLFFHAEDLSVTANVTDTFIAYTSAKTSSFDFESMANTQILTKAGLEDLNISGDVISASNITVSEGSANLEIGEYFIASTLNATSGEDDVITYTGEYSFDIGSVGSMIDAGEGYDILDLSQSTSTGAATLSGFSGVEEVKLGDNFNGSQDGTSGFQFTLEDIISQKSNGVLISGVNESVVDLFGDGATNTNANGSLQLGMYNDYDYTDAQYLATNTGASAEHAGYDAWNFTLNGGDYGTIYIQEGITVI